MSPDSLYENDRGNNLYYNMSSVIFAHLLEYGEDLNDDLFLVVSRPWSPPEVSIMTRGQLESLLHHHADGWTVAENNDEVILEEFIEEAGHRRYIDFKGSSIGPGDPNFHSFLTPIPTHLLPADLQERAAALEFFPDRLLTHLWAPDGPGFYYVYESPDRRWLTLIEFIPENYPSFQFTIVPNTFYDRWTSHQNFIGWYVENNNGRMYKVDEDDPNEVEEWEPAERFFMMMLDLFGLTEEAYSLSNDPAYEIAEPEREYLVNLVNSLPDDGERDADMAKLGNATLSQLRPVLNYFLELFAESDQQPRPRIIPDASRGYQTLLNLLKSAPHPLFIGEPQEKRRGHAQALPRIPLRNAEHIPLKGLFNTQYFQ